MRELTTASNIHRRELCPGSENMERMCPEPLESPEAAEGTMLHKHTQARFGMEVKEPLPELNDEQKSAVDRAEHLIRTCLLGLDFEGVVPTFEHTLFIDGVERGHCDLLFIKGKKAVVIDLKFGRIIVTAAASNRQMRTYALGIDATIKDLAGDPFSNILVAIVQPRASIDSSFSSAEYDRQDLNRAYSRFKEILSNCKDANAQRIPSEVACQYCRGALPPFSCPEARQVALALAVRPAYELLTPDERARRIPLLKLGMKLAEAELEHYRDELIKDPSFVAGATLKPGKLRTKILDAAKAYEALKEVLSPKAYASCCSVSHPDLVAAIKEQTGKTAKDSAQWLDEILLGAELLSVKRDKPSLDMKGAK